MIFLPSTPPHLPPNHQLGMLSLLPRRLATGPPPPSLVRHLSHWDWLNPPGKKYPLSLKAAPSPPADPRAYPPPPLDPTLVHVPIFEQFKDAHGEDNPHNIPPEGDEDHGRSGWGFQSRSRHEHFTFPGEPITEYYPDQGWRAWFGPGNRKFYVGILVVYFGYQALPERHHLVVRQGNDFGFIRTDSIHKQGDDDKRPLIIRLGEWIMTDSDDFRKELWDRQQRAMAVAERNRAHFQTLGMSRMSRMAPPGAFQPPRNTAYFPGDIIDGPVDGPNTHEDAAKFGVDLRFFQSQPPHARPLLRLPLL